MKAIDLDMTNGPIFSKILRYAIPIMITNSLQLFFNAADTAVVGKFAGSDALAAVGATTVLIGMLTYFLVGLSIGVNVLVARYYGAGNPERLSRAVHTAVTMSVIGGVAVMALSIPLTRSVLSLMGTPDKVLDMAALYMRIYCVGLPAVTVYNFGSTVLRAVGDTRRPMIYLTASGFLNVLLNLLFVIVFKMSVVGVALATILSQLLSAVLVINCLMKMEGAVRFTPARMGIDGEILKEILRLGIPASIQSVLFSFSNVLIQTSVNSFGATAVAGNTAAYDIESFIVMVMEAFYQANLTFTSQNVGAGKKERLNRILFTCLGIVGVVGVVLCALAVLFGPQLLGLFTTDPEVVVYGMYRMRILCSLYFVYGILNTMVGSLRGFGYSLLPTGITLVCLCLFRIVWVFTVFARFRRLKVLYYSFPATWFLCLFAYIITYIIVKRRLDRQM